MGLRLQKTKGFVAVTLTILLFTSLATVMGNMKPAEAEGRAVTTSDDLGAASGSNRFVVWRDTIGTGTGDIYFKRSTDNGGTWKASVNLSNNPGFSGEPRIAVSGAKVYVAWYQVSADSSAADVFFLRSLDNGITWGAKVKITPGGTCNTVNPCHHMAFLASSGTNVYLVTEKTGDIFLRQSSDNGITWKSPINISSNAGKSFDPEILVSGTNVFLVWTQANAANTSFDVLFRRSTDAGATWKSKVNLSNDGVSTNPDIASGGSSVHVVWQGAVPNPDNGRLFAEIMYRRSLDSGAAWGSIKNMSDTIMDETYDPKIAIVGSHVYLAWKDNVVDETKHGDADIFFRRSIDGGGSWESAVEVGHASSNYGSDCIKVEMAAAGTRVYIIWTTFGGCDDSLAIFYSFSNDSGASWNPSKQLEGYTVRSMAGSEISRPELAASDNSAYLVMTKRMSGPGTDIFFGRSIDAGQTWSIPVNLSKTSGVSDSEQFAM